MYILAGIHSYCCNNRANCLKFKTRMSCGWWLCFLCIPYTCYMHMYFAYCLDIHQIVNMSKLFFNHGHTCHTSHDNDTTSLRFHVGKKRSATHPLVESDVSLVKNCRKWRQNVIKIVEATLKFYRKRRLTWKSYKIYYNINIHV